MSKFLSSLKNLIVPAIIKGSSPNLPVKASAQPAIQIVEKRVYPELNYLRDMAAKKTEKAIQELEVFCTVFECLNEGLWDDRLDTLEGTFAILKECKEYYSVLRRPHVVLCNLQRDSKNVPKVFFEV